MSDEAVAKGIRRIICVTGKKASEAVDRMNSYRVEYENALEEIKKGKTRDYTAVESCKCSMENRDMLVSIKAKMEKDKYLPLIDRKKLYEALDAKLKVEWDQIKKYQKYLMSVVKALTAKEIGSYPIQQYGGNGVYVIRADDLHGDMKHMMAVAQTFVKKHKVNVLVLSLLPQTNQIESFVCVSSNEELKCGDFIKTTFEGKNISFEHESNAQASGQIHNN